jgi:hypothetical protein
MTDIEASRRSRMVAEIGKICHKQEELNLMNGRTCREGQNEYDD